MKAIATAILKAQSEMSNPKKDSANPYFKSKYADLNAVREAVIPILNQNGVIVLQPIVHIEGKNFVKTVLMHESGETIESLTEIIYSKANDAQAQGSGITYARRYGLQSLVCIGADDDDGNKTSQPPKNTHQPLQKTDENMLLALQEVKECTNVTDLEQTWNNWKGYHQNQQLKTAVNTRKNELSAK